MWLKPGKQYLFGRVKKDGVRFAIDHKTVSRKHFVITVDPVRDQDVGQVHARTRITITDEKSKAGTNIDGELIRGSSQELKNAVNSIRPGSCPHELVIAWQPCIMTFMLSKKELKNGDLKTKQDRVKDLDIKAVSDYLTEQTTHLVAQKRNTAKGLQALIEGKPIVTEAYIDALVYASTPIDLQEEENLCPLETDFDEAWPDPALQLPPPGKEPTNKPDDAYKPDPARAKIFDKYTFIFFDQSQYDTLLPPITTGHGKALLFKVDADATTVEGGQQFVKSAVGNLGRVIIVALNEGADPRPWLSDYIDRLCSKVGQEPASQSDFLDAVLANDASQLRKPRTQVITNSSDFHEGLKSSQRVNGSMKTPANGVSGRAAPVPSESPLPSNSSSRAGSALPEATSRQKSQHVIQHSPSQEDSPRPTKKARFVPPKKQRAAFDDDFDPEAIAAYEEDPSPAEPSSKKPRSQNTSGHVFVKKEPLQTPRSARNTSESLPPDSASDGDDMDDLLPAAAAMSREKAREEAEAHRTGGSRPSAAPVEVRPKPEKEIKLLNVREAVRAQREAEQERERRDREELDEYRAEHEELSGPANLVQIQTFPLPVRKRIGAEGTNGYRGETWKPEWDGRKNFKGFRRARDIATENGEPRRRRDKIIVPLAPFKTQNYGLGDRYWERTQEEKEKAAREKAKKKASQRSQSQGQDYQQDTNRSRQSETAHEDSDAAEDRDASIQISDGEEERVDKEPINPETTRLQAEARDMLDHAIDVDAPRKTRGDDTQTSGATKSTNGSTSARAGSKRPASKTPPSAGNKSAPKRQKTLPITIVHSSDSDDSDDSDDLKFKVGRGRKARYGRK